MAKRVSLILKDADEAVIAPFLDKGSTSFEVLRQWASERDESNVKLEASVLRALLRAGAESLQEAVLDAGYAALAEEFNRPDADAERRAARDRYVQRAEAEQ